MVFTTPGVDRVFIACTQCGRTMPHYRVYGKRTIAAAGLCACGNGAYKPVRLPEWRAAWWVLVVGWLWRKTICRASEWDPRMPLRQR